MEKDQGEKWVNMEVSRRCNGLRKYNPRRRSSRYDGMGRQASKAAPAYTGVFRYAILTGLRPAEVFLSLGLPNERYYNQVNETLEHYRFPKLFIRRTKKAYVSVMTSEIIEIWKRFDGSKLSYNALRLLLQHRNIPMKMNYCRKIHGTYLKQKQIDTDIIDLLHGRLPTSVFLRFYNRPGFKNEIAKVSKNGDNHAAK